MKWHGQKRMSTYFLKCSNLAHVIKIYTKVQPNVATTRIWLNSNTVLGAIFGQGRFFFACIGEPKWIFSFRNAWKNVPILKHVKTADFWSGIQWKIGMKRQLIWDNLNLLDCEGWNIWRYSFAWAVQILTSKWAFLMIMFPYQMMPFGGFCMMFLAELQGIQPRKMWELKICKKNTMLTLWLANFPLTPVSTHILYLYITDLMIYMYLFLLVVSISI